MAASRRHLPERNDGRRRNDDDRGDGMAVSAEADHRTGAGPAASRIPTDLPEFAGVAPDLSQDRGRREGDTDRTVVEAWSCRTSGRSRCRSSRLGTWTACTGRSGSEGAAAASRSGERPSGTSSSRSPRHSGRSATWSPRGEPDPRGGPAGARRLRGTDGVDAGRGRSVPRGCGDRPARRDLAAGARHRAPEGRAARAPMVRRRGGRDPRPASGARPATRRPGRRSRVRAGDAQEPAVAARPARRSDRLGAPAVEGSPERGSARVRGSMEDPTEALAPRPSGS